MGASVTSMAQKILPNLIVSIVMVTFSYAIVGFLIDLMYWIMYAVGAFVQAKDSDGVAKDLINMSFLTLGWDVMKTGWNDAFSGINAFVHDVMGGSTESSANMTIKGTVKTLATDVLGFTGGTLGALVVTIIVLANLFKLFFILIKAYASVLLYTIFSPFILMMQVFNSKTAINWVKSVAANLAPFVICFFMVLMLGVINKFTKEGGGNFSGWVPPYLITNSLSNTTVGLLVALGIIIMMPEIIETLKKKISSEGIMAQMGADAGKKFNQYRKNPYAMAAPRMLGGLGLTLGGGVLAGLGAAREKPAPDRTRRENFRDTFKSYTNENARRHVMGSVRQGIGRHALNQVFETGTDVAEHKRLQSVAESIMQSPDDPRQREAQRWNRLYKNRYYEWKRRGKEKLPERMIR
jgi:hypothetical protein